ncbi:MAG TPA: SGNH/GDSL hydrolase family protein [Candidatus Stackebrandtia faecavium]|nr:SGNH/GDSL hydrolase family protein [Candidatus Stackebrandtia faecavium]
MRSFLRLGLLSAIAALVIGATSLPVYAATTDYVALGDSYSSGTGTRDYYDEDCERSNQAYASQLAEQNGYDLNLAACKGAKIPDVRNNQLSQLSDSTDLVTMSIGGNDSNWGNVVTSCAKPWPWRCWDDIDTATEFIKNELPGQLDGIYSEVSNAAPNAHVVIVGYPALFNGESCNIVLRISAEEQERLNEAAVLLSETIGSVAEQHGFSYVDALEPFDGHATCDDEEWVNGLSWPVGESFHPNALGHDSYTELVNGML